MARKTEGSTPWGPALKGRAAWDAFATGMIPEGELIGRGPSVNFDEKHASVDIVHRDYEGLVFTVTFDDQGRVRAFSAKPMDWESDLLEIAPEITSRLLRKLPLGEMAIVAAHDIAQVAGHARQWKPWVETMAATPRPGRRGRPDQYYAQVAAAYCDALGHPTPVKYLATQLHVSPSQLRNLLNEARRRDLLSESPKGRAGGALTDKARRILEEGNHDGER